MKPNEAPSGMRPASEETKARWANARPSDVPVDLTFGSGAATGIVENARLESIAFEAPPEGKSISPKAFVTMLFSGTDRGAEITFRPTYLHLLYGLLSSHTTWNVPGKPDGERPDTAKPAQYLSIEDATVFTVGNSETKKVMAPKGFLPPDPSIAMEPPPPPTDKVVLQMRSFQNEIVITLATTLAEERHLLLKISEALTDMRFVPEEIHLFPKGEEAPVLRKRVGTADKGLFRGSPVRLLTGPLAGKIATIDTEIAPGFFGVKIDGASMAFPLAAFERLPDFSVGEAVTIASGALAGQKGIVLRQVEGKQGIFAVEIEGDDLRIEIAGEKLQRRAAIEVA